MQNSALRFFVLTLFLSAGMISLAGCGGGVESEAKYPTGADRADYADDNDIYEDSPSIFGKDGLQLFGKSKKAADDAASGIGVNSYLWRAALDTVSFMPLASADPFGGTILTDWYASQDNPNERLKLNVFILDRQLRASGLQVRVFRQVRKGTEWQDAPVAAETGRKIEDTILTRARQLRVASLGE